MLYMFALYWTSEPLSIIDYDPTKLSGINREVVEFMEKLCTILVKDILRYETNYSMLMSFFG